MKLQLLLHPDRRKPEAIALAKQIAATLGILPTAEGATTISAAVSPEIFESLFGKPPDPKEYADPVKNEPLPVPQPLRDLVQSITVAPGHVYMEKPNQ